MFIGRTWRKKRKVLLRPVPNTESQQPAMSRWCPPTQHASNREEDWFRSVHTSHRAFCGCGDPILHISHLAAQLGYQPGPSPRGSPGERISPPLRQLRALPAAPTTPRPPQCGGAGGRGAGGDRADDGEGSAAGEQPQEDVEDLLRVLEDAE